MDPVVDNLGHLLHVRVISETATKMTDTWQLFDVMITWLYPTQTDITSYGAFICFYFKVFVEHECFEGFIDSTIERLLVLKEVVDEF